MVAENPRFEYSLASVSDLAVQTAADEKSGKRVAASVMVDGEPLIHATDLPNRSSSTFIMQKCFSGSLK
jgi:hypothetical protein